MKEFSYEAYREEMDKRIDDIEQLQEDVEQLRKDADTLRKIYMPDRVSQNSFELFISFIILSVIIVVLPIYFCTYIVPEGSIFIVERFGAYQTSWSSGIHFRFPLVDRVSNKITLKEQVTTIETGSVVTNDKKNITVETVIFYQITDPKLFNYELENPKLAIENLIVTTMCNVVSTFEANQIASSREIINKKMRTILEKEMELWGIKVNRVGLKGIILSTDV